MTNILKYSSLNPSDFEQSIGNRQSAFCITDSREQVFNSREYCLPAVLEIDVCPALRPKPTPFAPVGEKKRQPLLEVPTRSVVQAAIRPPHLTLQNATAPVH